MPSATRESAFLESLSLTVGYLGIIGAAEGDALKKGLARDATLAIARLIECCEGLCKRAIAYKEVDHWIQPFSYSTSGGDDDNGTLKGKLLVNEGADDSAREELKPTAGTRYDCFDNRYQDASHFRKHERYSRTIDKLVEDGAKRDAQRLKEIGRAQYALELVERLNKRFAARADETQYRYKPEASNRDYSRRVQLRRPYRVEMTQTRDNMIANLGNDFYRVSDKEAA